MIVLLFLLLSIVIASTCLLITNNKIYLILYLIYIYMCLSILFMYLGVMILGIFYFLVYIGAVIVLFLFSIMILDIKEEVNERNYIYTTSLFLLLFIFTIQFYLLDFNNINILSYVGYEYSIELNYMLKILGFLIYKDYILSLIGCGLLLFISMIIAIYITNFQHGFFMKTQRNPLFRNSYLLHTSIY